MKRSIIITFFASLSLFLLCIADAGTTRSLNDNLIEKFFMELFSDYQPEYVSGIPAKTFFDKKHSSKKIRQKSQSGYNTKEGVSGRDAIPPLSQFEIITPEFDPGVGVIYPKQAVSVNPFDGSLVISANELTLSQKGTLSDLKIPRTYSSNSVTVPGRPRWNPEGTSACDYRPFMYVINQLVFREYWDEEEDWPTSGPYERDKYKYYPTLNPNGCGLGWYVYFGDIELCQADEVTFITITMPGGSTHRAFPYNDNNPDLYYTNEGWRIEVIDPATMLTLND